jgi:hypothetical protein
MTAPSSRLLPTGQLYTNGLDEATFNTASGYKKNLFTYSNNLGAWSASNLSVIPAPAPDGTMTAFKVVDNNVSSFHYLSQAVAGTVWNGVHTISFWAKAAENYVCAIEIVWAPGGTSGLNVTYNLLTGVAAQSPYGAGVAGTAAMTAQGNGWYYCTLTYNNLNNFYNATTSYVRWPEVWAGASPYVVYQGNGTNGLYVWQPQLEIGPNATIYEATDFAANPITGAGLASKIATSGLYVTGSIDEATYNPNSGYTKNLLKYSTIPANSLGGTYWVSYCAGGDYSNITTNTPNVVAPDGTYTAVKVVRNSQTTCGTGTGWGLLTNTPGIMQANRTYTASIWVRSAAGSVPFTLGLNDYYNGYLAQTATPQWQRFTYTGTPNGAVNTLDRGIQFLTDIQNVTLYYWAPQLELGAVATDYEPTDANGLPLTPGMAQRVTNQGRHYVTGNYDEVSGILATTDGLVANFDTYIPGTFVTTSPTTWTDSTDSKYYGVYQNFQNQSKYNPTLGAFNFDNTTNVGFNVTNQANSVTLDKFYTPTFSMEIWARATSFNNNGPYNDILALWEYYQVAGFRCGIATPNGLSTDTTGRPAFWTNQSGGNFALNTGTYPINLNTWFQTAVTYDGSTCNLYFNGTLIATQAIAIFKSPGKTAPFYIAGNNNGCQSFNGQMGIFRWYNRALTAGEAADNFAGNRGRFGI